MLLNSEKYSNVTIQIVIACITLFNVVDTIAAESPQPLTAEAVYRSASPAVLQVSTYGKNNVPLATGSAFLIGSNRVATCFHVLEGCSEARLQFIDDNQYLETLGVRYQDQKADVVILEVAPSNKPYLQIASETPNIGSAVYTIGNPRGLSGSLSAGIVSGKREIRGVHNIQITAAISPGNSGGPLLNDQAEVVGVVKSTLRDSQNLNFATAFQPWEQLDTPEQIDVVFGNTSTTTSAEVDAAGLVITDFSWTGRNSSSRWREGGLFQRGYGFTFSLKNNTSKDINSVRISISLSGENDQLLGTEYYLINRPIFAGDGFFVEDCISAGLFKKYSQSLRQEFPTSLYDMGVYSVNYETTLGTNVFKIKTYYGFFTGSGWRGYIDGKKVSKTEFRARRDAFFESMKSLHNEKKLSRRKIRIIDVGFAR